MHVRKGGTTNNEYLCINICKKPYNYTLQFSKKLFNHVQTDLLYSHQGAKLFCWMCMEKASIVILLLIKKKKKKV